MATRNGSAEWRGNLKEGTGTLEVGNGVFSGDYSFQSRFEEGDGTNPEELIAAAHAACFAMALSGLLTEAGHEPESLAASASIHLRSGAGGGPPIHRIDLRVQGRVPGIDADTFQAQAEQAKIDCPVSQALGGVPVVEVEATLAS